MKQKLESNANWIASTNNNLQICSHGRVVKALDLNSNGVSLWLLLESFDRRFSPYISVSRDSMGSIYMFLGLLFFKQNSIVEKQICVLVHNFACFKIYLSMHVNCNTLKLLCYCILLFYYEDIENWINSFHQNFLPLVRLKLTAFRIMRMKCCLLCYWCLLQYEKCFN